MQIKDLLPQRCRHAAAHILVASTSSWLSFSSSVTLALPWSSFLSNPGGVALCFFPKQPDQPKNMKSWLTENHEISWLCTWNLHRCATHTPLTSTLPFQSIGHILDCAQNNRHKLIPYPARMRIQWDRVLKLCVSMRSRTCVSPDAHAKLKRLSNADSDQ